MDAQSNSSKQNSAGRPSDTPNPPSKPRRMSVAQKALAPFAHLRSIQQQYGPGSVEAFGAQQQAEQTVQRSSSTKDQNDGSAQAQKDTSRSSDTYKTKTVPDVQRKIKSWELSMAKTQFEEWNDISISWDVTIEMEFERRLQDFTKSQGVELQDVVFTPIRFCKSRAEAQAHYEALLAEFRNTYKTPQAAADVAQTKVDSPAQPSKQTECLAQAPPQDQVQIQSSSEKAFRTQDISQLKSQVSNQKGQAEVKEGTSLSNHPMKCSESQISTQDKIPLQTQKGTPHHPAETQEAPQAQPLSQAPIQTKIPIQAKSQTPHSKLVYVQSIVKLNEVALAKSQVDYYSECDPEDWARIEKHFAKRIEGVAKRHGVDLQDVDISSVPLAKSQAEAQAQYKTLYNMVLKAGHSKIAAEQTAPKITQKGWLAQVNLLNQIENETQDKIRQANKDIELLKKELAETRASQDQTLKEFNAKSEKTRLEHLQQVDYFQRKITTGQVENQLLKTKLSKEESNSIHLRASLEKSEKEVERLREALKAKSEQKVRVPLPFESVQLPVQATKNVQAPVVDEETAKAKATLGKLENAIQAAVQASWKAKADEKAKAEAEEKAKIEAKAQIYAQAYVKAKYEAKAKARAEAEAKNKAQSKPLCCSQSCSSAETSPKAQNSSEVVTPAQLQIQRLHSFINKFTKSYHDSAEKYLEQIRCLEYDIQKLTEQTDYEIERLKKEVAEKDDKILELQKELWKVIDERQEARLDAEKLAMQLCTNNW